MAARLLACMLLVFPSAVAAAADPALPTAEELKEAKTLLARQQLYCQRLVNIRRDEAELVEALFKTGTASKEEVNKAAARLQVAEQQLAQVKGGEFWRPTWKLEPAKYEDELARLTREEKIAKDRHETGLAPASAAAEGRRQRLRLQWTFGPEDKRAEAAVELAKVLRELLGYVADFRREGIPADIDELGVRRELVAVLPAAEAAKERQALNDQARQSVEVLQARFQGGVISKLEVYRGTAAALEALLALATE